MPKTTTIRPNHKAIRLYYQYYQTLKEWAEQDVTHEGAVETVNEFKKRVPELAKGLVGKLKETDKSNKKFQAAFADFFTLCQKTLNPNISRDAA